MKSAGGPGPWTEWTSTSDESVEHSRRMGSILVGHGEQTLRVDVVHREDRAGRGLGSALAVSPCIRVAGVRLSRAQALDLRRMLTDALDMVTSELRAGD